MFKKAYPDASMLEFADFNKPSHLETDASKLGLGVVLWQKQTDGQYHLVVYINWSLTVHKHNYHSTKQEFLALKWVVVEQSQEYLLQKPFTVKNDSNPLTYIMTTPNLDATQHRWVESLVGFSFSIEYQKGWDNAAADSLSWVTLKLDVETVKSILDRVTVGTIGGVDAHDPAVAESNEEIHKQVWPPTRKIQYLRLWLSGFPTRKYRIWSICLEMTWTLRRERLFFDSKKADALPGSPLPSPHTSWQVGRSFAVGSPHSSSSGSHEWMWLSCWTQGSAENSVPT